MSGLFNGGGLVSTVAMKALGSKKKPNTIFGSTEEIPFPVDPNSVQGRTMARKRATQAASTRKGYTSTILSQDMYK